MLGTEVHTHPNSRERVLYPNTYPPSDIKRVKYPGTYPGTELRIRKNPTTYPNTDDLVGRLSSVFEHDLLFSAAPAVAMNVNPSVADAFLHHTHASRGGCAVAAVA